jgi:hypothetical protein
MTAIALSAHEAAIITIEQIITVAAALLQHDNKGPDARLLDFTM